MKKIFIIISVCVSIVALVVGGLFVYAPTRTAILDYVKGEITNEITNGIDGVNGVDGKDGVNGIDGKDGINGVDGKDGINGIDGKDGTNGTNGTDGKDGQDGINGIDGQNGLSAYEIAVENGFVGTEQEWLDSLKGFDGKDGQDGKDGASYFYVPDYLNGTTLTNQNNVSNTSVTVNQTGFVYVYFQCSGGKEMTVKIDGATVSQINANCGVLLPVAAGSIVTVTGGATGTITITFYSVLVITV